MNGVTKVNYDYCNGYTHTIKQGDTLYALSRSYQVPLALLLRANPYVDVYNLQPGDTVCIPMKKADACRICRNPLQRDAGGEMDSTVEEQRENREPEVPESPVQTEDVLEGQDKQEPSWIRRVTEQGETMADVLQKADMSVEEFLSQNPPDQIGLLPGIAYYMKETD